MDLAGYYVDARELDAVVDAVRRAYLERGAIESSTGRLAVRVGEPEQGWSLVVDSTHHTVDMGVAEAVASAVGKRVAVFGMRGRGSRGRGSIKVFGAWRIKPPTSLTAGKVPDRVAGFAHRLPEPWELETRAGTVLTFDVAKMKRTLGPFKDNGADVIRELRKQRELDASWHVMTNALNKWWDAAKTSLAGLVDRYGWQYTCSSYAGLLGGNVDLDPTAARLAIELATRALEGVTASNFATTWEAHPGSPERVMYLYSPLIVSAVVAQDGEAFATLVAGLDNAECRRSVAAYVRERYGEVLENVPTAWRKRLDNELPVGGKPKAAPAKSKPATSKPAKAKPPKRRSRK